MARRSSRLAKRRKKAKLGTKQLPKVQPPTDGEEAPRTHDEPASDRQNANDKEQPISLDERASIGVGDTVRVIPGESISGEPEQERLGHWPYQTVKTPDQLQQLVSWLQVLGGEIDKTPVGIAVHGSELAFATRDKGWVLASPPSEVLQSLFTGLLVTDRASPQLTTRSIPSTVDALLLGWLLPDANRSLLIDQFVHDMTVLSYTTGQSIASASSMDALQDALDAATVGPMMALEAPRFYMSVGLPVTKYNARAESIEDKENLHRWTLTYDYLLFKLLAHYTRDPTLVKWLLAGKNPAQEFATLMELEVDEAVSFLLWLCCAEDSELMPSAWVAGLPDNPQLLKATRINKRIPTLQLGLLKMLEDVTSMRRAITLYGRKSPRGLRPAELLRFQLFGSLDDILDVALASILRSQSKHQWLIPETTYNHWMRAQLIGYTEQEPIEWQRELEEIGELYNPFGGGVSLEPKVGVE